MTDFDIKVREEGDITILETSGYLNNFGVDRVASICNQSISEVEIFAPIRGLQSVTHKLVAINNSNGVGINSMKS